MRRVATLSLTLASSRLAAETEDRPLMAAYCIGVVDQQIAATVAAAEVRGLRGMAVERLRLARCLHAPGQHLAFSGLSPQLAVYKQYLALRLRTLSPYATRRRGSARSRAASIRAP